MTASRKLRLIAVIAVLLLVAAGIALFWKHHRGQPAARGASRAYFDERGVLHTPVPPPKDMARMRKFFGRRMTIPRPIPVPDPVPRDETIANWWESPNPLTQEEIEYQRYLSKVTWRLPREKWTEVWGQGETGLLSPIRFGASFGGYGATLLGMHTPAYPKVTGDILRTCIDHFFDKESWKYIEHTWGKASWFPDPLARQNIMYSGHLFQLLVYYEMMTGDDRFSTTGFDLRWDDSHVFHYDIPRMARVIGDQMKEKPSGGVNCEPTLIFFCCNDHHNTAMRILEKWGRGDWSNDRRRFERWSLASYYDGLGTGVFRLKFDEKTRRFSQIGFPPQDAWSILWYMPWATDPQTPKALWELARPRIRWDYLRGEIKALPRLAGPADYVSYMFYDVAKNITPAPATAFLYGAASGLHDAKTAAQLKRIIEERYLVREDGTRRLRSERPEHGIAATGLMAIGVALENGSDVRALSQNPLPMDYFDGPYLAGVSPDTTAVYQAYRKDGKLVLEIEAQGPAKLTLANVPSIAALEGAGDSEWSYEKGVLTLTAGGRRVLAISSGEGIAPR
jgi:hypothetical protein